MKIFRFLLLLLLCFLCSCLPPRTYAFTYVNSVHGRETHLAKVQKIYIENTFGNADRVAIREALDRWQYALNGYFDFRTETADLVHGSLDPLKEADSGQAWLFMKIDSKNALVVFHDRPKYLAMAFTDKIGGNLLYLVRDRVSNGEVRGLVMHEMGHLLGAQHRRDDNLMQPVYHDYNAQCIDQETLSQVAAFQHLPLDNMNYCVYLDEQIIKED